MNTFKHYTGEKKKIYENIYTINAPLNKKKCETYLKLYEKCLVGENDIIKCHVIYNILEKCINKID